MPAEETPQRIEPARLEDAIPESLSDLAVELASASAKLGHGLHPRTSANLAALVRLMNTYYSNLIEGHNTRPKDIERALAGQLDEDQGRRNLQIEAAAHVRVALSRGEFERGEVPRITGLSERTGRRVFNDVVDAGLLASETPKGPVSLRFPADTLDILFPRLFLES